MVIELSSESEAGTPVKPNSKRVKQEISIKRYAFVHFVLHVFHIGRLIQGIVASRP